jgi:hypothetical protein
MIKRAQHRWVIGCHFLKTDQRGQPRPDPEDTGGCDIGAYESQSD